MNCTDEIGASGVIHGKGIQSNKLFYFCENLVRVAFCVEVSRSRKR